MAKNKAATPKPTEQSRPDGFAPTREELARPDVLQRIFSRESLRRALARIAKKDKDNLVTHPLKSLILTEYRDQLADELARSVPTGTWSPSGAYVSLTVKRSGAYRELVFPTLIDGIVGRCLIDSFEPQVNADDDNRTFSGRSHFSNARDFGDYGDWFQVWQDYSAAVDKAARSEGFTYVFDTDIHDFFPSVDRTRAKALLAARTGAHPSLLELLFYCLEAWLPRFTYAPMTGLPVEANDVSRVVAHAYLKSVDAVFKATPDCIYLRYVDDTVVFAKSAKEAHSLRRLHHLELRQLGLNPNAAKSEILTVEAFQAGRHREFNARLDAAKASKHAGDFETVATDWFALDCDIPSWDKVTRKIYSIARQLKNDCLRDRAVEDAKVPSLSTVALPYVVSFDLRHQDLTALLEFAQLEHNDLQSSIAAVSAILDARIDPAWSADIVSAAFAVLHRADTRHGIGYLKAQWLLALHKYGARKDREALRKSFGLGFVDDPMWRLHYLYVALSTGLIKPADAGTASLLASSDVQLAIRLCGAAASGRLQRRDQLLARTVRNVNGRMGLPAQYLPIVRLMLETDKHRTKNVSWLKELLARTGSTKIHDQVVVTFLRQQLERLIA